MVRGLLLLLAPLALGGATSVAAQAACEPILTRTAPGPLSGMRITSLQVVTLPPDPLPGVPDVVDRIHVRTQPGTVRRELLFTPGDTIDTLRVAESMRRLRHRKFIADAWLEAWPCEAGGQVALTVTTRDAWSTRPEVKLQSSGYATVGVEERNLLGTGREASVYVLSNGSRFGLGAMFYDPWLPYTNLSVLLRTDAYRNGSAWAAQLQTRRRSVFDRWGAELFLHDRERRGDGDEPDEFRRESASLLGSVVIDASPAGATSLLFGIERERVHLSAAPNAAIVGPSTVRREYVGVDVGLRRATASYDTLTWLLPERRLADVPRGFEWDGIIGIGRDRESGHALLHLDLWGGRVWHLDRRQLLVADVWTSGFWGDDRWDAARMRASLTGYRRASRGLWVGQLAAERLFHPDPDVRALSMLDPTLPVYPDRSQLAEMAVAASLERDVRLRSISRSWVVDGALFAAASVHADPVAPNPEHLYAAVVGVGLRLAPLRVGRGTFRVDLGIPIAHSPGLEGRPYLGLSVIPWLGSHRARDGLVDR